MNNSKANSGTKDNFLSDTSKLTLVSEDKDRVGVLMGNERITENNSGGGKYG